VFNIWANSDVKEKHIKLMTAALKIADNLDNKTNLIPNGPYRAGGNSWLQEMCYIGGRVPFWLTCSDKINVIIKKCGENNAYVSDVEIATNFPKPANESQTEYDNIYYQCLEMLDAEPVGSIAITAIHEIAHVLQHGFGQAGSPTTEGGATYMEGQAIGLPLRPMVYSYGFDDWNKLLAANIFDKRKPTTARKFYQLFQMWMVYLQTAVGKDLLMNIWQYRLRSNDLQGQEIYDYFIQRGLADAVDKGKLLPKQVEQDKTNRFINLWSKFKVALAGSCLDSKPKDRDYRLDIAAPYWDCGSFKTYNGYDVKSMSEQSSLAYGGNSVVRLMNVRDPVIKVPSNPNIQTSIISERQGSPEWLVVNPTNSSHTLSGYFSNVYVVQTNVDPMGDVVNAAETTIWRRTKIGAEKHEGKAWHNALDGKNYLMNQAAALRTKLLKVPENGRLSFDLKYKLEGADQPGSDKCQPNGYDSLQLRLWLNGKVHVLQPNGKPEYSSSHVFKKYFSKDDQNIKCEHFLGWSDRHSWVTVRVDMRSFRREKVMIEFLFLSDDVIANKGVWLDNLKLGNQVIDNGDDIIGLTEKSYLKFSNPTKIEKFTKIPYLVSRSDGRIPDKFDLKLDEKSLSSVSATFDAGLQRSSVRWTGGGFSTPFPQTGKTVDLKSAFITPGTEVHNKFKAVAGAEIKEVVLFVSYVSDIQQLKIRLQQKGKTIGSSVKQFKTPQYAVDGIQRFVFNPPLKLSSSNKFSVIISVTSSKKDETAKLFKHKQGIACLLSTLNSEGIETTLRYLEGTKKGKVKDPFGKGYTVPIQIMYSTNKKIAPGLSEPKGNPEAAKPQTEKPQTEKPQTEKPQTAKPIRIFVRRTRKPLSRHGRPYRTRKPTRRPVYRSRQPTRRPSVYRRRQPTRRPSVYRRRQPTRRPSYRRRHPTRRPYRPVYRTADFPGKGCRSAQRCDRHSCRRTKVCPGPDDNTTCPFVTRCKEDSERSCYEIRVCNPTKYDAEDNADIIFV